MLFLILGRPWLFYSRELSILAFKWTLGWGLNFWYNPPSFFMETMLKNTS